MDFPTRGTFSLSNYPKTLKQKSPDLFVACLSRSLFPKSRRNSIFTGLPDSFEVARYHSLHGIKESLPADLQVTALTADGTVMGIQHTSLPFAAVQFHPESILTSPAHGMTILQNALTFLKYPNDPTPQSGSELVGKLEVQTIDELRGQCDTAGLVTRGSKSELVVRLALWAHKSSEAKAGRLNLEEMTDSELQELKQGLGLLLQGSASAPAAPATKQELLETLQTCLLER
jgi:hypothetical protein